MKKNNILKNVVDKVSKTMKISEVRKNIAKYISKNRLTKVTIFEDSKYYGTLIYSKKSKIFGYSKLNKNDKEVDKSIGTFYAMYRYLDNLENKTADDLFLISDILDNLPKGFKKLITKSNPKDEIINNIFIMNNYFTVGYNRFELNHSIVKYWNFTVNGLDAGCVSQDVTKGTIVKL